MIEMDSLTKFTVLTAKSHFLIIHCRPGITRMSGSTTSDRVVSESRYTEVFHYVTNGIQS